MESALSPCWRYYAKVTSCVFDRLLWSLAALGALACTEACNSDESLNPAFSGATSTAAGDPASGAGASSGTAGGANGGGGAGGGGAASGPGGTGPGGTGPGGSGPGGAGPGGGGSGGSAVGTDCNWGDPCGPGLFCDAAGCGPGKCKKKPPGAGEKKDFDPVCGCDHVSYWNENIAAIHGAAVKAAGACAPADGIACSGALPCPAGASCNEQVADVTGCALDLGQCWGVPVACGLNGPTGRACTNSMCELQCSLIQSNNSWYADATCP
jgi:hypothetical protein